MDPDGITLTAKGGSSIALTEDNIDIEAGDGATAVLSELMSILRLMAGRRSTLDQNVDIDGNRIDLN